MAIAENMDMLQQGQGSPLPPLGLHVHDLSVRDGKAGRQLLEDVDLDVPQGSFVAVIGASGCGKSTLLKALAGIRPSTEGVVLLGGHPVEALKNEFPLAIGYLGQFGAFLPDLTVKESLQYALDLRLPKSVSSNIREQWLKHITQLAGIQAVLGQPYKTLSGGQMRRVAMAEELIGDPPFLFLDELTSGLDEYSDYEMMVWLRSLAHQHKKTVVLVTHATYHLDLCDSIVFLSSGRMVKHGSLDEVLRFHNVTSTSQLLALYKDNSNPPLPVTDVRPPKYQLSAEPATLKTAHPPNGAIQFPTLLNRQGVLFFRDRGQLWIQLLLILVFPVLVAVFALTGLPEVRNLNLSLESNIIRTMQEQLLYLQESFRSASLVSGLAMFQVILLTLMGANNSAREIAKDGPVLQKELRVGLSPLSYVLGKFLQITLLSTIQAFWMAWFVKTLCGFPGSLLAQFSIFFATTLAMGSVCLAISAASSTPERASLLSIYLVGFQMPLSGAALALPSWLSGICQPFIAAYWGWSGYLMTFKSTRHYDVVKQSTRTEIASFDVSIGVLIAQIMLGIVVATFFVSKRRENDAVKI